MPSRWDDLDRAPLSAARIGAAVRGSLWRDVRVVDVTGSTNADVATAARSGAAEGLVVIAEQQRAGRGRLDRGWEAPARSGLLLSMLLRPGLPPAALPLLPLVAGIATVEAIRAVARVEAVLKWPNDVLVDDRKLGGILAERVDDAVVVGIGLNVSTRADELPVPSATSVALAGGRTDREPLAKELLRAMARRYDAYRTVGGAPGAVLPAYRAVCTTIGRDVAVHLPSGGVVRATAVAVDDHGQLVTRDGAGTERAWSAGDVVHVR